MAQQLKACTACRGPLSLIPNTHVELPLTPAPSEPTSSSDHTYKKQILKRYSLNHLNQPGSFLHGSLVWLLTAASLGMCVLCCLHGLYPYMYPIAYMNCPQGPWRQFSGWCSCLWSQCCPQSSVHVPLGSPEQWPGLTLTRSSWPSPFHNTTVWFTPCII